MMIQRCVVITLCLLALSNVALAIDFSLSDPVSRSPKPYQGEAITFTATVTADRENVCDIQCSYSITNSPEPSGNVGAPEELSAGESKSFGFDVNALGTSGTSSATLTVVCAKVNWWCLSSEVSHLRSFSFQYEYNGDNQCALRNDYESCINARPDCPCPSGKSCVNDKGDQNRGVDERKCATYCSNNIVESSYENCNNCPVDVGKCDGVSCTTTNECEGKYCVHNKCSHLAYIIGDSFCDEGVKENCKNSGSDCACASNERCNPQGFCETFCGNGVCEEDERGKCKPDCTWCGDGTCQDKESCSSCADDCGACKTPTKQEELKRNIGVKETTQETESATGAQSIERTDERGLVTEKKIELPLFIAGGVLLLAIIAAILTIKLQKRQHIDKEHKCLHCNKRITTDAVHCYHCGKKVHSLPPKKQNSVENKELCKCGAKLKPGKKFCHKCGKKI